MKVLEQALKLSLMIIGMLLLVVYKSNIESDGVFFADPTLGDLEVNRYHDDILKMNLIMLA